MKLEYYQVTHGSWCSCTRRKWGWSERWRQNTHRRAQSLHVLKRLIQFLLHLLPLSLPPRLRHLLPCLKVCFHLGLQYLILGLEYKANVCKNQGTTDKTEITLSASIWVCAVSGRGHMAGLELVLLARICARVGVLAVSITLSPIQYLPCFLPPPTLMTISASMGAVLGSNPAHGPLLPSSCIH